MLRLVERGRKTGYGGDGSNIISWNFGSIPVNLFGIPLISDTLGEVYHEYEVYAENAVERYDAQCNHTLTNFKYRQTWRGVNLAGAPVELIQEGIPDTFWWNSGIEQQFTCGVGLHGHHVIDEASILGDPVEFPTDKNGSWTATMTDGFATVSSSLSITGGTGSASVTATSQPGSILAAYASGLISADVVGRASWHVIFKPIYPNGRHVTDKHALVVLGQVESTGVVANLYPDRVAQLVHERLVPIDETFSLPQETVRSRVVQFCGAVWQESVAGGIVSHTDTAVDNDESYDAGVWSRRNACIVVWSRKAFGQTASSLLDDLGNSVAIVPANVHASRYCWHRLHQAAGSTYVRRATLSLPTVKDFELLPWRYNSGGIHELEDDLLDATSGTREFWSNLGNENDYGDAHEFRPYRWLELDVESETVQSQTFTLQWNLGIGGTQYGSKSWVAGIARGKQTLRVDLRDPDLVNGVPVESIEQLDERNPATAPYMPISSVQHTHRFGGMAAVNSLRITLPSGAKLRVSKLRLVADEATVEHWRGNTPVGGLVDKADHLRVNGNGITTFATSSAWDAKRGLEATGVRVTGQDWTLGAGWLHQSYGLASIVDKEFNPIPPGNLLSGCPLYSTHAGSQFVSYWGMSQEQPIGTAPVLVEVEGMLGHRLTATAIPPVDSALTIVWPPGSDRTLATGKDGAGRLNEPSMQLDFPPVNPRVFCPRHTEPREEETLVWASQPPTWSGMAFSPRGSGRKPSRDVNAGQRHVRAIAQDGLLTTGRRDNTTSGTWTSTRHDERSQGASARVERAGRDQRVHLLNERAKSIRMFRSRLDAETVEPVKTIGAGEFPTQTVLPGNRVAQYWTAGTSILGHVVDRDGSVLRGPEVVVSDAVPVGIGVETAFSRGGLVGTLLTYQRDGYTVIALCRDCLSAEEILRVEAGDLPEILALRDGRRFLYWSPEASGEVRGLVVDGRAQIVRPIQTVVTGLDPYTGISVREASGIGGSRRVWMSAVRGGESVELHSQDGIVFA